MKRKTTLSERDVSDDVSKQNNMKSSKVKVLPGSKIVPHSGVEGTTQEGKEKMQEELHVKM